MRPTALEDVLVIEPTRFEDERGWFMESWNRARFGNEVRLDVDFVQDNHSHSTRSVLRGIHYQLPPFAQGKLVRVVRGSILDVAVDLRRSSATFAKWVAMDLSAANHRQMWIPPGFGHGFLVTSQSADVLYKATAPYSPSAERCIRWNDESLGIDWGITDPIVGERDSKAGRLNDAELFA